MQIEQRKLLAVPLITTVPVFTSSILTLSKGIEQHQTWRIVAAGIGFACMLAIFVLIGIQYQKIKRTSAEK